MAKCSRCGAEDDLAIPFIDGVCEACIRREAEAKHPPKEVTPRVFRETKPAEPPPPKDPSAIGFGEVLDVLGILTGLGLVFVGLGMDTTVSTGIMSSERVYNSGLQQSQLLAVIIGLVFFAVASIDLAIRRAAKKR